MSRGRVGVGGPYGPGKLCLWDAQSGAELASETGHMALVTSLAFSADGKILATAGLDNTVKFWDVVRRKQGD